MAADECVELGNQHDVEPERQLGLDALLQAGEALLGEPAFLEPGERLLELREGRAPPDLERGAKGCCGIGGAATRLRLAAAGVELLEPAEVERVPVELDDVPRRARDEQAFRELLAQLGDEDLDHLRGGLRHLVAPDVLDEPAHRDDPLGVQQQQREEGLLLASRQLDRPAVVGRLERPKDAKVHAEPLSTLLRRGLPTLYPMAAGALAPGGLLPRSMTVDRKGNTSMEPIRTTGARRWFGLAVLCTAFFMVILDVAIVNVALPSIQADLAFSQQNLQWVVSAYALTFGGLLLLGGRTADLLGRRRVFIGGVALFALASLLAGLAPTAALLVSARALQGIGAAAMTPAALSILMTTFREGAERNKALAAWGAVGASGLTIGLLVGGVLTETVGWKWIFLLNVPVGVAVIALTPVLLDETRAVAVTRRFDLAGAATVTAALSLLVYALVEAGSAGWSSPQTVGLTLASVVLLAAFGVIERRSSAPLVPFRIFRLSALLGSNVAGVLFGAAVYGMFFVITLYLQQVLGYSPLDAGFAWLALSLTALVSSVGGAGVVTRIGARVPLVTGLGVAAAGIWLLARVPAHASYASDLLPALIVTGIGVGLSFVTMSIGALEGVEERDSGLASGLVNTTQQIGGALGVAVLSTIAVSRSGAFHAAHPEQAPAVALTAGFDDALVAGAAFAAVGALLAALLIRRRESSGVAAAQAAPPPLKQAA